MWLSEQIQVLAVALLTSPPPVVLDALADVGRLLADPSRDRDTTLDATSLCTAASSRP